MWQPIGLDQMLRSRVPSGVFDVLAFMRVVCSCLSLQPFIESIGVKMCWAIRNEVKDSGFKGDQCVGIWMVCIMKKCVGICILLL